MNWHHQTVVITGAYGGLGKVLCKELAKLGARLVLTGRNTNKLDELSKTLPNGTVSVSGDITTQEFQLKLVQVLAHLQSDGHILINNAGVGDGHFLENQSIENIQKMLEVNLLAPILLSKALKPWLQKAPVAKIINIGSTFGAIGFPGFSSYCASKFGLRGFSQALGRELSDTSISVQYLAPRSIETEINSDNINQLNKAIKNNVDTAEQVVPQIVKAIEQNNAEKFFGWPQKLFAKINGLFPSLVSGSIKKQLQIIKTHLNK